MAKGDKKAEAPCLGEILTNARTFFASGKIVNPDIHHSLDATLELPDKVVGRIMKKYVEGLPDVKAGQRIKEFFDLPDEETLGAYVKACATRRLERIKERENEEKQ